MRVAVAPLAGGARQGGHFLGLVEVEHTDTATALRKGTMRAPTRTTLEEAADDWLAAAQSGISPHPLRGPLQALGPALLRGDGASGKRNACSFSRRGEQFVEARCDVIGRLLVESAPPIQPD